MLTEILEFTLILAGVVGVTVGAAELVCWLTEVTL